MTLTKNWKSTVLGLCILLAGALNGIHFDPAGHLLMTARDWFSVAGGVLGAIVGFIMKDAEPSK